jgi:hypothetical protein
MKAITDAGSDVVDVAYKAMNGEIRVMPWTDVDPTGGGRWSSLAGISVVSGPTSLLGYVLECYRGQAGGVRVIAGAVAAVDG